MDEHSLPYDPRRDTPVDAGSQALSEALRSSFVIIKFVTVVLIAVFLASGFFTVGPQQQAVILRCGRPVGEGQQALLGPGLHWSWPYPIDEPVVVSISGIQQVRSTMAWYATTPEQELAGTEPPAMPGTPINPEIDGYALTADTNIIHLRATLTYHINDPVRYIFNSINSSNTLRNALDNALLYTASQFKVDEILTSNQLGFREAVRRRASELISRQDIGVVPEECVVDSKAPRQLQDAFHSVIEAEVRRGVVVADARGYASRTLSQAGADATLRTNLAEIARKRYVNDVSSRAQQFLKLLPTCNENPSLFVQRRLSETLAEAMTNVQDKIFLTEGANGQAKELRLLLNREPPKSQTEETK